MKICIKESSAIFRRIVQYLEKVKDEFGFSGDVGAWPDLTPSFLTSLIRIGHRFTFISAAPPKIDLPTVV